jgi:precorrin-6A/cobalt-precorrin-6A reductase
MTRILLLGGTAEANRMAEALAKAGLAAVYSYAGRTETPAPQPIPVRIGGFGGVARMRAYLRDEGITRVVDATHPFADAISFNAHEACTAEGIPLIALERAPWVPVGGYPWTRVEDTLAAVAALQGPRRRVFLAIGRQELALFAAQPQHRYLVRLVDAPTAPLPLPDVEVVVARGPYELAGDMQLLRDHAIEVLVTKNAGGKGAVAKLGAAMALGLEIVMIDRPMLPPRRAARNVKEVMDWLAT